MSRGEAGPWGSPRWSRREAEGALLSLAGAATALATLACAAALAVFAADARGSQERSSGAPAQALAAAAAGPSGAQIREAMALPLVPVLGGSPEALAEIRSRIGELEGVECRPLVRGALLCSWTGPRGWEAARLARIGGAWRLVGVGAD